MSVAFTPDEFTEAIKEYEGIVVAAEYSEEPFEIRGAPGIKRGKQLCLKIETEEYEKPQYAWYPPSSIKKTKWDYFIKALADIGVLKDVDTTGKTVDERMESFARSMIGMRFAFVQKFVEGAVREKGSDQMRKVRVTLPVKYLGKEVVSPQTQIREEKVVL